MFNPSFFPHLFWLSQFSSGKSLGYQAAKFYELDLDYVEILLGEFGPFGLTSVDFH